ncbi:MAG: 2Fe-2S iron-sulfur cluster-binding protein [Capsulimonadales bacterium]|nr:2Fe-2S iron-sulfur cluster-binding protein [Capsulimonadales bacterium]
MAGTNPYISTPVIERPKKPYRITIRFEGESRTLTVEPRSIPYDRSGQPGSILDICEGHDIPLEHTCGGVCACSTCHVIVREGFDSCNEATDDELDQLEEAPGITRLSRLGCQCVPNGSTDVIVEIPGWNRNAVKETPHD